MRSNAGSRVPKLFPLIALVALALPASASAQATRTWVSGLGDDANPCSRTAPCKTFAGAISKTATNGEINCIDPGGFGGVTITKSIAIKCHYTEGGVLVSGTNAIVVNAATTSRVTLKGLDINGIGTGLNGVRILQAKSVKIVGLEIFGFVRNGIDVENNSGTTATVVVDRTHVHDNTGNGVVAAPANTGNTRVHVRRSTIDENGCGVAATAHGMNPAFTFGTACGTNAPGATSGSAVMNVFKTGIADSATHSVFSRGSGTFVRIGENMITGSLAAALQPQDSGQLNTYNNNMVVGNPGGNGTTTGSAITFAKRKKR